MLKLTSTQNRCQYCHLANVVRASIVKGRLGYTCNDCILQMRIERFTFADDEPVISELELLMFFNKSKR